MIPTPRILIFTGDGKGKTTAALGMALRAAGHGLRTCIVQFIKSDAAVGEMRAISITPFIEIVQAGKGFLPPQSDPRFAAHAAAAADGLQRAAAAIDGGRFSLVVLDEVCLAVARGLIEERQVVEVIRRARPGDCIVLTGRGATRGLIELADTVTRMECVKHGLSVGRTAQKGVEM